MMRHLDADDLTGYVLGESTDASSAAVEQHLAECAACRAQETELRRLLGGFADLPSPRPRTDILDALLAEQRGLRVARRRRTLQGGLWTTATVAAVAAVFAVGFWTGRRTAPDLGNTHPASVVREDTGRLDERDLAMPQVVFVAAIPDRVAGLAKRDTTTN